MNNYTYCSFFKNNGIVVYNNLNVQTGLPCEPLTNCSDGELIDNSEIFINKNTGDIYHKCFNICDTSSPINVSGTKNENIRYLQWKETRKKDWDWFITDVNINDLIEISLIDTLSPKSIVENKELSEKLQIIQFKTEVMTNTYILSKKYHINNLDSKELTEIIKTTLDEYMLSL